MSRQFWISSGHHLLDHDTHGRLVPTADFWRVYLARPEIVPPAEACLVERALYDRLCRDPRAGVTGAEIADIADRDARENWRHLISFRDRVEAHGTIEAAYADITGPARAGVPPLPPLFASQLVHVIARNMLDAERDAFVLRAAEMLFRAQRLTMRDGVMLVADEEQIDLGVPVVDHASPLTLFFEEARAGELEVLSPANAASYFRRSDAFDLVMDFRPDKPARAGFARVIEAWVAHMLGHEVTVTPVPRVEGAWRWFVGLDAEGTRIGNALWEADGRPTPAAGVDRIVALFELTFADPRVMGRATAGAPVYLILAMTAGGTIRVKPQNLLTGLPLERPSTSGAGTWSRSI